MGLNIKSNEVDMKEKTKSSKIVYQGKFMNLLLDRVILPDNSVGERVFIKHPGGAAVLPITKDNRLILVYQYRYPIQAISLEIPAGKKDHVGEDSLECAKRELEEETGYVSEDIKLLYTMHPCVGYSDEVLDLFIAKDCVPIKNPKSMDEDEFIEVELFTVQEAKELLLTKRITDAKTIIAIQAYLAMFQSI
jgi:ADP-ribose pyrophosphatase